MWGMYDIGVFIFLFDDVLCMNSINSKSENAVEIRQCRDCTGTYPW